MEGFTSFTGLTGAFGGCAVAADTWPVDFFTAWGCGSAAAGTDFFTAVVLSAPGAAGFGFADSVGFGTAAL